MSWYRKPALSADERAYRAKHAQLSFAEIKALYQKAENWLREYADKVGRQNIKTDPTFIKAKKRFDILNELYNLKWDFEQAQNRPR